MPPVKVFVFVGSIAFILLVGFLMWEPDNTNEIPCATGLHSHGDEPEHCDP